MSSIRSFCPEILNDNLWYYLGMSNFYIQPLWDTTFDASKITERLFLGNISASVNKSELKKNGITHIITVVNGGYEVYPDDFSYLIVHINDDHWVNIDSHFDKTNKFIKDVLKESDDNKILIHCKRGVSRSATILLAHLINEKITKKKIYQEIDTSDIDNIINDTIDEVRQKRSVVHPNDGFINGLKKYFRLKFLKHE